MTGDGVPALRIGNDVGVGLVVSRLDLMRLPDGDVPAITAWTPRILDYPRYLVAADFVEGNLSLRPVFVGALVPVDSGIWNTSIWRLPPGVSVAPGTFLFTTEGLLAGVAVEHAGALSLVPAHVVLAAGERLAEDAPRTPGQLGITVEQTSLGLAVAWVDPAGPTAKELAATDLIEAVNGESVPTVDEWRARMRNVASGDEVKLRVRSEGELRDVTIAAAPVVEPPENPALGLRVRTIPRAGVEVLAVAPRSRADRAGIQEGDLITVIAGQKAPTAAQLARAFDSAPRGEKLLAAVTRGDDHHVFVIEKGTAE
jgi:hypothetical protein